MGSVYPLARRHLVALAVCVALIASLLPLGTPTTALAARKLTLSDLVGAWGSTNSAGRKVLAFDKEGYIGAMSKTDEVTFALGTFTVSGEANLAITWTGGKQEPVTVKIAGDKLTITSHDPPSVYTRIKTSTTLKNSLWTDTFRDETRVWGFGQDGSLSVLRGERSAKGTYKATSTGDIQMDWEDDTSSTWHAVPLGPNDLMLWDPEGWIALQRSGPLVGVWNDKTDPERLMIFDALGYMLLPDSNGQSALTYSYNSQKGTITIDSGSGTSEWRVKLGGGQMTITDKSGISHWTRNTKALVLSAKPPEQSASDDGGWAAIIAGLLGVALIGGAVVMMAGAAANNDDPMPTMVPYPTPLPMPTMPPFTAPAAVQPSGCDCDNYGHAILSCQGIVGCEAHCQYEYNQSH